MDRTIARPLAVLGATAVLAAVVVPLATAGAGTGSGDPRAAASASVKQQLRTLRRQVRTLRRLARRLGAQVRSVEGQPGPAGPTGAPGPEGPQGAEGPQGVAAPCEGNEPQDVMVVAGPLCVDRYEASIWDAPTGGNQITGEVPCSDDGQDCDDIYARSVPGVLPSVEITWFQAQRALANSGKRLPTSAEWQLAVAGTPDSEDCNIAEGGTVEMTGSYPDCASVWNTNDMVGNVAEWAADWVTASTAAPGWGPFGTFASDDLMALAGASTTTQGPGALIRGGSFGAIAGPFYLEARVTPQTPDASVGFRGVR
jgi:formylglycine-generating enzyme required for sulfatase activity